MEEIIFDVETKKLFQDIEGFDPGKLGVSIVSLYRRTLDSAFNETSGKIMSFWENDFKAMWELFQTADRVIGFNSLKFDVPALMPYANFPFNKLKHFDIMDHIKIELGRRISLDSIAKITLNRKKIAAGTDAVYYWEKGDPESLAKLKMYCEEDVLITKDVYDFGRKNGYLKYIDKWNSLREVKVDFSYKPPENSAQGSLF